MRYIVKESNLKKLVWGELNKLVDPKKIEYMFALGLKPDGSEYEDNTRVEFYLDPNYDETIFRYYDKGSFDTPNFDDMLPILQIDDDSLINKLNSIFGNTEIWEPILKRWFEVEVGWEVKTIWGI